MLQPKVRDRIYRSKIENRFRSLYMRVEKTLKESGCDIPRFNQGDSSTGFFSVPSGLGGQTTVVGV